MIRKLFETFEHEVHSEITEMEYNKNKRVFSFKYSKFKNNEEIAWRRFELTREFCEDKGIINMDKIPDIYMLD